MLYRIQLTSIRVMIQIIVLKTNRRKLRPNRSKQSYFFEHKEIKKPLQLPEILGLLKAQK